MYSKYFLPVTPQAPSKGDSVIPSPRLFFFFLPSKSKIKYRNKQVTLHSDILLDLHYSQIYSYPQPPVYRCTALANSSNSLVPGSLLPFQSSCPKAAKAAAFCTRDFSFSESFYCGITLISIVHHIHISKILENGTFSPSSLYSSESISSNPCS